MNNEEILHECLDAIFDENIVKTLNFRAKKEEYIYELNHCMSHITLEITQNCSMRCDYCIYSGHYIGERTHSDASMDITTAMQAIDFFEKHSDQSEELVISFYGGEALLNFDLVQKVVCEGNKRFKNRNIVFRIATNGTTISPKICDWLNDNENVYLDVTLNGNVQDKYRKLQNGQGSLAIVETNLKYLYSLYPSVAKRQICYICNYADFEELLSIKQYYEYHNISPTLITGIARNRGDESIQLLGNECVHEEELYNCLIEEYISRNSSFTRAFFEPDLRRIHNRSSINLTSDSEIENCCFPFMTNCFVDANGNLTFCEKMPGTKRIGNVYEGIDLSSLLKTMSVYLNTRNKYCRKCWAQRLCTVCYADNDDMSDFESACNAIKKYIKECLKLYCFISENYPDILVRLI